MPTQGHRIVLKQSGTAVLSEDAAMTQVTSSKYKITSASQNCMSPLAVVELTDNGNPVAESDYRINYLFGVVTRNTGSFTGPLLITYEYLPLHRVAEGTGITLNFSTKLIDATTCDNSVSARARATTLVDCSGTLTGLDTLMTDIDPTAETIKPFLDFMANTTRVVEVTFYTGTIFRCYANLSGVQESASTEDILKASLDFTSTDTIHEIKTSEMYRRYIGFAWDTD